MCTYYHYIPCTEGVCWSGQVAALQVEYSGFGHITFFFQGINILHYYLHTTTCSENEWFNYPRAGDLVQSDGSVALFGQQSVGRKKKKGDLTDATCYGCWEKGHLRYDCWEKGHLRRGCMMKGGEKAKNKKPVTWRKVSSSKVEVTTAKKPPSGIFYTAVIHATEPAKEGLTDGSYVDSGASDHLILLKGNLHAYREYEQPLR